MSLEISSRVAFLFSFMSQGYGKGWFPANECGCMWVSQSCCGEGWGVIAIGCSASWVPLCHEVTKPRCPAEVTSGNFSPMTQVSMRKIKMLSEGPVLKFCSCIILNWKHKWKLRYILDGQGVRKGRDKGNGNHEEVGGNQRPSGLHRIAWQTTFGLIIRVCQPNLTMMTESTADK